MATFRRQRHRAQRVGFLAMLVAAGLVSAAVVPVGRADERWTVSIVEHGARPGKPCGPAIQAAIEQAANNGGGTVVVPPGRWITGTIQLKSNVTLHVATGATLQGSPNLADYPPHPSSDLHFENRRSLIYAENAENISITGGGVIDGNGRAFWRDPKPGSRWYRAKERPTPMIELRRCRGVRLKDVRIANSPGWTVHPYCCDEVVIDGVSVKNHLFGPNTDGFDINGCRDVQISDCRLVCGDDAIIIKATPNSRSTERVAITNCIIQTNCIGVGIGQETQSDVRQVAVSNCVFQKCHRLFAIGIWDGGVVEDVTVTGLVGDSLAYYPLARPIQLEVKQHLDIPRTRPLGVIRNVNISNVNCRTQGRILVTAQEGGAIENVSLRDVRLAYVHLEDAAALSPADGKTGSSQYANRNLFARRQCAAVVVENAKNIACTDLSVHWPAPGAPTTAKELPPDGAVAPLRDDPPYRLLWARGVDGLEFTAPLSRASRDEIDATHVEDCRNCRFHVEHRPAGD